MKTSAKIQIQISEVRSKLNGLAGETEALTEEQRATADAAQVEYADLEVKLRASLTAEGDEETRAREMFSDDPAAVEYRALVRKASIGRIFDSVMAHGQTSGPEAELQQHRGLASNQIPLALLETRAVTPGPTNVGTMQQEIIPYVFPASLAAFLSVDVPTVPVGEAIFPVLTSELSVEALAAAAAGTETTGAFAAEALSPSRLQASFYFSREDRARFQGLDESLRMNLSQGLSDGLDAQIAAGTKGLWSGTNLSNNAASATTTFASYVANMGYGRVDGRYAPMLSDIRIVMGQATFAHAGTVYRGNNSDENSIDRLMSITAGVRVSAHVPAVSNAHKQNAVVRLGTAKDMVAPIWEGIEIIPDSITKASSGQIVLTAVMLHAVKILRMGGFVKIESQHQ